MANSGHYAIFGMITQILEIVSFVAILIGIIVNGYILLIVILTKQVLIGLGCGWILTILFSLPQLLLVSPYHYNAYYGICLPTFVTSGSLIFNTGITVLTIFLPIFLILGCNMKVLMIARHQRHRIASAILEVTLSAQLTITHQRNPFFIPSFSSQVVQNSTSLKNNSPMSNIFQLCGSIFIIYCPYYICSLWNNTIAVILNEAEWSSEIRQRLVTDLMVPKTIIQISVSFLLVSPFFNALFYGIKNKVIRKSFHNFWRKQKSKIEIHYEIQARTPSTCGSRRPSINETNSAQPLLTKQLSETFVNTGKADINSKHSDMKLRSESQWSSNSKLSSYSVLNSPTGNLTTLNLTPMSCNEPKFVYLNPTSTSTIPSTIQSTHIIDPPIPITSSTSKISCNIMSTVRHYSSHSTKPKIKITKTFSEENQPSPQQGISHPLSHAKVMGVPNNTKSLFNLEHADDNLVMKSNEEKNDTPREAYGDSTTGTINTFTFKKCASLQEISITSATVTICDILK